jgi:hypothetical protein
MSRSISYTSHKHLPMHTGRQYVGTTARMLATHSGTRSQAFQKHLCNLGSSGLL